MKYKLALGIMVLVIGSGLIKMWQVNTAKSTGPESPITLELELVDVSFDDIDPVYTTYEYTGTVRLIIEGSGQAGGNAYSDAFYLYTNNEGYPLSPPQTEAFDLEIDGDRAIYTLGLLDNPPAYNSSHQYEVIYNVGPQPRKIAFRISDYNVGDNTGAFHISVIQE